MHLTNMRKAVGIADQIQGHFPHRFSSEVNLTYVLTCVTIASACMKVFVTNFLPPKSISIPLPDDYRREQKNLLRQHPVVRVGVSTQGIFIQHALNTSKSSS